MKIIKLLSVLVLSGILLIGCEKGKKEVEIVPDLESVYMDKFYVDEPAKVKSDNYIDFKKELIDAVKTLDSNVPADFDIDVRLYLNEDGTVDKLQDISKDHHLGTFKDSANPYKDKDKLIKALAVKMANWQFEPARKAGKNVKSRYDLCADILKGQDGTYKIDIMDFLSNIPDINEFVRVDKMPQVKNPVPPKYPELAKRNGNEGTVYVKILVDRNGKVARTHIIKSENEIFNQAALDAAAKFEFTPAYIGDKAISVWVVVPFKFKL